MSRLLLVAALAVVVNAPVHAQTAPAGPAYVVAYVEASPLTGRETRAALRAFSAASRKEAGNAGFVVLQRIDRPYQFLVLEGWKDAQAQKDHAASAGAKQFQDKLKPLLVAPYDERLSFGFMTDAAKKSAGRSVYAVSHVDFVGAKKDDGLAALKQLSTDSAKEKGRERFDIWQQVNRPNHITLIETWSGMPALETHERAEPSRKFRDALLPIGGALFDQRLYRAVN